MQMMFSVTNFNDIPRYRWNWHLLRASPPIRTTTHPKDSDAALAWSLPQHCGCWRRSPSNRTISSGCGQDRSDGTAKEGGLSFDLAGLRRREVLNERSTSPTGGQVESSMGVMLFDTSARNQFSSCKRIAFVGDSAVALCSSSLPPPVYSVMSQYENRTGRNIPVL